MSCNGNSNYGWRQWFWNRIDAQFHDEENYTRTSIALPASVFAMSYLWTREPEKSSYIALISCAIFPLYHNYHTTDHSLDVKERAVDKKAEELNQSQVEDLTQISELQDLISDELFCRTALEPVLLWGKCTCTEFTLYHKPNIEHHLNENQNQCPCCKQEAEMKEDPYMGQIIGLMQEKKWDEILPLIDRWLDGQAVITINQNGKLLSSDGKNIEDGYRLHTPLNNLIAYIKGGGKLGFEQTN